MVILTNIVKGKTIKTKNNKKYYKQTKERRRKKNQHANNGSVSEYTIKGCSLITDFRASMHGVQNLVVLTWGGSYNLFTNHDELLACQSISLKQMHICGTFSLVYVQFCSLLIPSLGITIFYNKVTAS